MESIKDTVTQILSALKEKKSISLADDPEALLKRCLTKKQLGHIKVTYFKKGVVGVNVDSSAWLYQLSLEKDKILGKIQTKSSKIRDIKFRLGEI